MNYTVELKEELIKELKTVSRITGKSVDEIIEAQARRFLLNFRDGDGKINPKKGVIRCSGDRVTVLDESAVFMGKECVTVWAALDGFGPGVRHVMKEDVEVKNE